MNIKSPRIYSDKLHILLVEDLKKSRELYQELFASEGFVPITAESLGSAISELHATPQLSLVVTDVNLGADAAHGGIELLVHIRAINPRIPVVAYSSHFEQESEFSAKVVNSLSSRGPKFDRVFPKVTTAEGFKTIVAECTALARNYLARRREEVLNDMARIEADYPDAKIGVEFLRSFFPNGIEPPGGLNERTTVEQILSHEGYMLNQVYADYQVPSDEGIAGRRTSIAVPVWVREEAKELYIAELYGYSSIYAEGEYQKAAIESLLVLMLGYHLDFKRKPAADNESEVKLLQDYLALVFRGAR